MEQIWNPKYKTHVNYQEQQKTQPQYPQIDNHNTQIMYARAYSNQTDEVNQRKKIPN